MQNPSKTQLFLPIPPATHLLLFVIALGLAAILAFVQQSQFAKPSHNNNFRSSIENPVVKAGFAAPENLLNISGK